MSAFTVATMPAPAAPPDAGRYLLTDGGAEGGARLVVVHDLQQRGKRGQILAGATTAYWLTRGCAGQPVWVRRSPRKVGETPRTHTIRGGACDCDAPGACMHLRVMAWLEEQGLEIPRVGADGKPLPR
mgnify:CR=1 FL=1